MPSIRIVNKLLLMLKHYKLNLPSNVDIDHQTREAFGLLLNDESVNYNTSKLHKWNPSEPSYSILNNKIQKCAMK